MCIPIYKYTISISYIIMLGTTLVFNTHFQYSCEGNTPVPLVVTLSVKNTINLSF